MHSAGPRQRRQLDAHHLVRTQRRHRAFELGSGLARADLQIADNLAVDVLEIDQLLVEMARQQQRRIVLFALGDLKGPLAELYGQVAGTECDRNDKGCPAQDQPLDHARSHAQEQAGDRSPQAPRHQPVR